MPEKATARRINNRVLDKMGVWVSAMCGIHCLILPILLPALPIIASTFVAQDWFERSILTISIIIGFAALFIGFRQYHRQLYPMYSLGLGAVIYWNKDIFGHDYEPFTVAAGALFIIAAHLINLRLCKQCKAC
ncbi:MerC family mercury resistance protein [Glaciecola sp. XM2]|uniref:MerC domain-containing protein n=1 Tax=Glaciecola sp. XM2 TaxID=1914931 RepID=UPI001BDE4577|nr:MerC domain-containing protein [Glaciecola sp. XM2]MBT1450195.1 MerC family mercury resistance protein [Glaciecola sp. XM2]